MLDDEIEAVENCGCRSRISPMRSVGLCAVALVALSVPAVAADMPILRGSQDVFPSEPVYFRWQGVYVGGQAGYASGSADLSRAAQPQLQYLLRESVLAGPVSGWELLDKGSATAITYGGFVGYNFQWDDAVLGVEANYNRTSFKVSSAGSLARSLTNPSGSTPPPGHTYTYNVTTQAAASINVTDVATFRARGGWAAGPYMPYAFVGAAVGRADVSRSASFWGTLDDDYFVTIIGPGGLPILDPRRDTYSLVPGQQGENKSGVFIYGWTAGLGLDVALTENIFLRGEWEWVQFGSVEGISVSISSIRGAVGAKF
jgi:opacity protein-like surface antigen